MLRAGAISVFEGGMVYFCSAKCKAGYKGRPRPLPGRPSRPPSDPFGYDAEQTTVDSEPPPRMDSQPPSRDRESRPLQRIEEPASRSPRPESPSRSRVSVDQAPPSVPSWDAVSSSSSSDWDETESEDTYDDDVIDSSPHEDAPEPSIRKEVPKPPSTRSVPLSLPLSVVAAAILFIVSVMAIIFPESPATRLTGLTVQLAVALVSVLALAIVAGHSFLKKSWRSAMEEGLVFVGASFTLVAGLIDWHPWGAWSAVPNTAVGALAATPGIMFFTWLGRWLEVSLQHDLLRRLEPLRRATAREIYENGLLLWGDSRSENIARRSWAEQAGAESLGIHPVPGSLDLLRQTAATKGEGASPTGLDATRWSSILMALALPTAVVLVLALFYWERDHTATLLLAAATVLALNPRALRRGWVGPMLAAAGRAAKRGVLFRDGAALEATARSHWVVFDTHGTLTWGEPRVTSVVRVGDLDEGELLAMVAGVEKAAAQNPLGDAIVEEAQRRGIAAVQVRLARNTPGMGVTATSARGDILVGTRQLLLGQGISVAEADEIAAEMEEQAETVVFIAHGGRIQGVIGLRDERQVNADAVAGELNELGVEPVMMTGDSQLTADTLGEELGFEHIRAEVAPDQWATQIASLRDTSHGIAMVANPPRHEETLAAADVGMALGTAGLEIDSAGVALEGKDPGLAVKAVAFARSALRAVRVNLFVAVALMISELGLASLALSSMSEGPHAWGLTIAVPVVVALGSSIAAALMSWEVMTGNRSIHS